ncbi:MAG: hypothetical protein ACXWNZ_09305 [Vulcanimicrobiaceae bacterium]
MIFNGAVGAVPLAQAPPIPTSTAAAILQQMLRRQKSDTGVQPVMLSRVVETKIQFVAVPPEAIDWTAALLDLQRRNMVKILAANCSNSPVWWGGVPIFERFYVDYSIDISKIDTKP